MDGVGMLLGPGKFLSSAGLDLIKRWETLRLTAYPDGDGWSIGYGHHGKDVTEGMVWTQDQADWALMTDAQSAVNAVNRLVTVPLTQGQFDSLVDFTYNLGEGHLEGSTLLRLLNAGDYAGADEQFKRWILDHGKPSENLLARRNEEENEFRA